MQINIKMLFYVIKCIVYINNVLYVILHNNFMLYLIYLLI